MILFSMLFALSAHAFDASSMKCEANGKIKFQFAGREVQETSAYCFDASRSSFASKSCVESEKCGALQSDACKIGDWIAQGSFGTPGFKLCQALNGNPQILDFFDGKKWWSMDRCYFESDQSFVDTGILLEKRRACPKH